MKLLILFFIVILIPIKGYPQETSKEEKLPEIVITATKVEESPLEVSSFVKVITEEEIDKSPAKTLGDIFPELGLGHTHKYPGALTSRISIRGICSDLFDPLKGGILILVDGQRISTANLAKISLEDVERIEVVKGPFSVLYGTQAMGGVINIITKKPKKEGIHLNLKGETGSWDYWKGAAELSIKKNIKKNFIDFYILEERSSQGDYQAKHYGEIDNTSYNENTIDAKLGVSFLKDHYISFGYQQWNGWDIGTPGAIYNPTPENYSDKKRDSYNVSYKFKDLKIDYTYTYDRDEWHSFYGSLESIYTKIMRGKDLNVKLPIKFKTHRVVLGGEYYNLKIKSKTNLGAPYYPNSEFKNYGVFAQIKLNIYKEKIFIISGGRYDYFKTKILRTPGIISLKPKEEDIDHFSGNLGFLFRVNKNLSIKANVGEAFRTPTADELATDYISSWGTHYLGNSTLDPEEVISFDIGLDYGGNFGILSFSYFYNKYNDKIVSYYNVNLNAKTYKNIKGATIQGIEFSYSNDIGNLLGFPFELEPFISLTYHLQYKDEESKRTLWYIPKSIASFGIRFNYKNFKASLTGIYNGDEKVQDWAPPYYGSRIIKKKDFTIFNAFASYQFKKLETFIKVENLFNRKYEYVKYYPMPEASYYVGFNYKF